MSKHPGPWFLNQYGQLLDGTGAVICEVATEDPETRAVLLHAAEMWTALKAVVRLDQQNCTDYVHEVEDCGEAFGAAGGLVDNIEAEIAKGKP